MSETITIQAIYEDGVFKPLSPLELPDKQQVELHIDLQTDLSPTQTKFGGILAPYWEGEVPDIEEINTLLNQQNKLT